MAELRVSYDAGTLLEGDLAASPLEQFHAWFDEAVAAGLPEPNAMIVATASEDAQPSARTVLLKDSDPRGFTFYTNYGSRKSDDLSENPGVSCVFPWFAMHRQVVVVGRASRVSRDEADAYFQSRPYGSRLGAWASRQSTVIDGRTAVEAEYERLQAEYPAGSDIPIPEFWGGWLIRPVSVEFWQGRESRLHDRLRFLTGEAGAAMDDASAWVVERLSP
ncbi:MAG: pyridoxamine 5'-phosphate oxidase [Gaiellales bacterium]|nr:pyridoxamine 5'-phosphate oxidase [Gaiellales bacterium]